MSNIHKSCHGYCNPILYVEHEWAVWLQVSKKTWIFCLAFCNLEKTSLEKTRRQIQPHFRLQVGWKWYMRCFWHHTSCHYSSVTCPWLGSIFNSTWIVKVFSWTTWTTLEVFSNLGDSMILCPEVVIFAKPLTILIHKSVLWSPGNHLLGFARAAWYYG